MFFSACTPFLIDEIDGGHSPMMQLNGTWSIDRNVAIASDGLITENQERSLVWFNATQDQGDYCEGTWLDDALVNIPQTSLTYNFLWGFRGFAKNTFVINNEVNQEEQWEVLHQSKNRFEIERQADGITYQMDFSK